MSIKAITFDLWDTIVHDDSDEPKRQAQGLRSKYEERRYLLWNALQADREISHETVKLAFDVGDAAFNKVWREHHITWPISERLDVILKGLKRERPSSWDRLVHDISRMEVDLPPDIIANCRETLEKLAGSYRLAIVSDAIVTPGTELRRLLELHGVRSFFSSFAFSDEVGHSKPHPSMFAKVAEELGVAPKEIVHIGDRDHNDIKGAQAFGAKAILFTATRDVDKDHTSADAICASYAELANTIAALS